MKKPSFGKNIVALVAIVGIFIAWPLNVNAQYTQDFYFTNFTVDYYLEQDENKASTLKVKEELVAVFPESDQNHGILRAIPERYQDHTLSIKDIKVVDDVGLPHKFTTYRQNDNLVLKIGSPDKYVHGKSTYKISYTLRDVISYYDDHNEFFWDVNGDQWSQSFLQVDARVHIPSNLRGALQAKQQCYSGVFGSKSNSCTIQRSEGSEETIITASASNLEPRETLSVVLGFTQGTFTNSSAVGREQLINKIKVMSTVVIAVAIPLVVFVFMFMRWRQFGNDPKGRGIIIPEYSPPKGFDVLMSDFLLKEKIRNEAIAAMLIEMAVNNYLNIYEIPKKGIFGKKDFEIELKISPTNISASAKKILSAIFGDNLETDKRVKLSEFQKSGSLQLSIFKSVGQAEKTLADSLHAAGYFIKDPHKVKNGYQVWAYALLGAAGLFGLIAGGLSLIVFAGVAIGALIAALIIFAFGRIMPAKSKEGVVVYDALIGLKDYIKLAEADRIRFLQSPEGAEKILDKDSFDPKDPASKIRLFENLLPYAMLFGLEKEWAKQFNSLYTTPPGWYNGNWASFNAGYLAGSLSDFSAASSASFSSPSSSSGSGFSGGGSGGGGGGGGGGGW